MKADCSFRADSIAEVSDGPIRSPVGPIRGFRLRVGFFFISGGGTSPRFIARFSCWSAFFWRVEVGFRRGGMMVLKIVTVLI